MSRESGIPGQRKASSQCLRAWAFPRDTLLRAVGSSVGLSGQTAEFIEENKPKLKLKGQ